MILSILWKLHGENEEWKQKDQEKAIEQLSDRGGGHGGG